MPWRVPLLDAVLDNLLTQTLVDFDVHLYIPPVCRRTGEAYPFTDLREPRIRLRPVATDYGPATKLLGPCDELRSGGLGGVDVVVTVDDDVLLERHAVEELVHAATRFEGALGFMGVSEGQFVHSEHLRAQGLEASSVGVLGGYRAVLYPIEVLDDSLLDDYRAVAATCDPFLDDDNLFSWNLARRGIARRVIATAHPGSDFTLNATLLDLSGPVTASGEVDASHEALIAYYGRNRWPHPS